jgi:hypothetical protein
MVASLYHRMVMRMILKTALELSISFRLSDVQYQPKKGLPRAVEAAATSDKSVFPAGELSHRSVHKDGMSLSLSWMFQPTEGPVYGTIDMIMYESTGPLLHLEYLDRKARFDKAGAGYQSIKKIEEGEAVSGPVQTPESFVQGIIN